jgi:hypothetical protein
MDTITALGFTAYAMLILSAIWASWNSQSAADADRKIVDPLRARRQ